MSSLTTSPEALAAAAGELQTIGAAMTAQNAASAGPISALAPAAGDEVSALQAAQFSAYGTLYEHISAQASAIQEMFVHTLRTNAGSYEATEAGNAAANTAAAATPTNDSTAGQSLMAFITQESNWGSATSDLIQMSNASYMPAAGLPDAVLVDDLPNAGLADATAPGASLSAAPLTAVPSTASASAPPTAQQPSAWGSADEATPASAETPVLASMATAGEETEPGMAIPAGVPAAAAANRGGPGFGRPRYGVKPTVMPRKPIV